MIEEISITDMYPFKIGGGVATGEFFSLFSLLLENVFVKKLFFWM